MRVRVFVYISLTPVLVWMINLKTTRERGEKEKENERGRKGLYGMKQ